MVKTHRIYQERAYLRRSGHRRLDETFIECARLYNAALEHRRAAWKYRRSVAMYEQFQELTAIRAEDEFWGSVSIGIGRGALCRLNRAYQAFFRRVKAGEKPGYPRFRASRRWKTIEIAGPTSAMITNKRGKWVVKVKGLPILAIKPRRELPNPKAPKTLTITRKPSGIYVSLGYAIETEPLPETGSAVGLDMGVAARVALSDGSFVERRRTDADNQANLQRRIARCRRGSNNQHKLHKQLARLRHRETVRNRNECHRITTKIVRSHDLIAIEDLKVANMTRSARGTVERPGRRVKAKAGLNHSIAEQSWGIIAAQLAYKAEWYGRTLVRVDPKHTSQICSGCGTVDPGNRRDRRYECRACGLRIDVDTNAAVNILARRLSATGVGTPPGLAA